MTTEIMSPDESYKIAPEALEVVKTYIQCHDISETALSLGIDVQEVNHYLRRPEVRRFVDTIFLEQGYMNQMKIQDVMDAVIEAKLEEMQDTEMGSSKDILDILALQHKMRMEIIKASKDSAPVTKINKQVNLQNNAPSYGTNLDALVNALEGKKEE